jgi:hypothetical protein
MGDSIGTERRKNSASRRNNREDRRNAERITEDPAPRRDPERRDRRKPE